MSLYNMVNGVKPTTFFVLPMLGKHPDEYPRFRDCFLSDEEHPQYDDHIHIYTRTGGGNREGYEAENDAMRHQSSRLPVKGLNDAVYRPHSAKVGGSLHQSGTTIRP